MQLDEEQQRAVEAVRDGTGHVTILAYAGSGKTTTLIECVKQTPGSRDDKLLCAFNRTIAQELQSKASQYAEVMTLHSLGLSTLRMHRGDVQVSAQRGSVIAKALAKEWKANASITEIKQRAEAKIGRRTNLAGTALKNTLEDLFKPVWSNLGYYLGKCVSFVKNVQPATTEELRSAIQACGLANDFITMDAAEGLVRECLTRAAADTALVDFDDMLYLPRKLQLRPLPRRFVFLDEAQDMNRAQNWLARQSLRPDGRMVLVGDPRQAIYAWRGAEPDGMLKLANALKAQKLPLHTSYRCARSIIDHVRASVSDLAAFQARPNAPDGSVDLADTKSLVAFAREGDYILSRTNAPLLGLALRLSRAGRAVTITGRDFGRRLQELLAQADVNSVDECRTWCTEQLKTLQTSLLQESDPEALKLIGHKQDEVTVLLEACKSADSLHALSNYIERTYADSEDTSAKLTLSTVHQAKGQERDRVWLLVDTFHDRGRTDEGDNLYYVAATRAKHRLYLVTAGGSE